MNSAKTLLMDTLVTRCKEEAIYINLVLDSQDARFIGWSAANSDNARNAVTALEMALSHPVQTRNLAVRTDGAMKYCSTEFENFVNQKGISYHHCLSSLATSKIPLHRMLTRLSSSLDRETSNLELDDALSKINEKLNASFT